MMQKEELLSEIQRLGPWHLKVKIRDGIDTGMGPNMDEGGRQVSLVDGQANLRNLVSKIYPDGLKGKTFFDNACNCGGYSFWAKDLGAKETFGFDVRDHWIDQAEFIRKNREGDTSGMTFRRADLYDIPAMNLPSFDMTWFSGIFYHLPDPVTGLKIAADRTREVLYLNTAMLTKGDEERGSGQLYLNFEGSKYVMSGVHNLNWFPSGPKVLIGILNWLGFPEVRIRHWQKRVHNPARPAHLQRDVGRIALVAARERGMLKNLSNVDPVEAVEHAWRPEENAQDEAG
jgi:SAM-dependent methyltransferase